MWPEVRPRGGHRFSFYGVVQHGVDHERLLLREELAKCVQRVASLHRRFVDETGTVMR